MKLLVVFFCLAYFASGLQDWLVTPFTQKSSVNLVDEHLVLTNGLVSRKFQLMTGMFGCVDYFSHEKKASILRAINPETIVQIDGITYNVGGFNVSIPRAYLNRTDMKQNMSPDKQSFQFVNYVITEPAAPYGYTPRRGAPSNINWPPKGIHLMLMFRAPASAPRSTKDILVTVHYEIYDGIPLISKWISMETNTISSNGVKVSFAAVEILSTNWQFSEQGYNWMWATSNEPHGTVVEWSSELNADSKEPGSFQPVLKAFYSGDVSIILDANQTVATSFKVLELITGTSDHERTGLSKRRMTRLLTPQTLENPIYFHMTDSTSVNFRSTVDQLAEVGFEMIMYSFGSGFNLESTNQTYLQGLKEDIAYANSKGIEVGGYDLIAWTRVVDPQWMAINATGSVSDSACFASGWYDSLLSKVLYILDFANLTAIETDGPYSGYVCSSTNHSHHHDVVDSVYKQNLYQSEFYKVLREKGMYINQPDTYFFQGGNKAAMGYNEEQFSLPRWLDLSISRQGMFDDTFQNVPSQGWMFLPLVVYQGGGQAAMFEPLAEHLKEYEWGLGQYMGAGVAACYRGTRVYDQPQTRDVVKKWVNFYKTYRQVLNGDLIHVRRGDMQSIDSFMHINSNDRNDPLKGIVFFFNPTNDELSTMIEVPLYYTGLTTTASVSFNDDPDLTKSYQLRRDYFIEVPVDLGPQNFTWAIIREPNKERGLKNKIVL